MTAMPSFIHAIVSLLTTRGRVARRALKFVCLPVFGAGLAHGSVGVGATGSGTLTFDSLPAAGEWATGSMAGSGTTATSPANLDTYVNSFSSGAFTGTLGTLTADPSSTTTSGQWNSTAFRLTSKAGSTAATCFMTTLQNTSGGAIHELDIGFTLSGSTAAGEDSGLAGYALYYSLTGNAGTWQRIGIYSTLGAVLERNILLGSEWADGATLHVLWVDDNGSGGTDGWYGIDDVSFAPSAPGAKILAFTFPGYGPATINGTNISLTVLHGTEVTNLSPTYVLSYGANCNRASGSSQDFTGPVTYTVTSSDNLVSQDYTVTVHVLPPSTIYYETFGTPAVSGSFAAAYPGFTQSGPVWNVGAGGYATTDSSGGGYLWRTMSAYDWSMPMTVAADVSSPNAIGGQSIGVFFSSSAGPGSRGITFRPFLPSFTNGAFLGDSSGSNRSAFGIDGNHGIDPDCSGSALAKISLTIRQNEQDSTKFDWLAQVNDTEVWTAVADGGTWTSGWHIGIAKSVLNASGGLATFGIGYDGMFPRVDNLTLKLTPYTEAAMLSFGLPGLPATITGNAIGWNVGGSMNVHALAPVFTMSPGATCVPPSGTVRDFATPQTYTVTSQDGQTQTIYTVTVTGMPLSSAKNILTFSTPPGLPPAVIGENTITVTVPLTYDVAAMSPIYTVSSLAGGSPASGTTLDFTTPQVYTITAEDLTKKAYTVTVVKAGIPVYQETFGTQATIVTFPDIYTGFNQSGPLWNVSADGYATTDTSGGGYLWRTMSTYDWSSPLTVSAEISSPNAVGGQSLGVFLSTSAGPGGRGITFRPYLPSTTYGAFAADSSGNNRSSFGVSGNHGIDPDCGGSVSAKVSLTIRRNEQDSTKFDWLAQVNDTDVWTAVGDGGTGTSGWHIGIAKSVLNASGGLASFGIGYDGMIPRIDNLTLYQAPLVPTTPYQTWLGRYPSLTGDDTLSDADPDGDGMTNFQEFAFGLDPTKGVSANPIIAPLDPGTFKFTYTRLASSGLNYTVWTSADLEHWDGPAAVSENVGAPDENGVVTVQVTLTSPPAGDKVFVRVAAR